MNDAAARTLLFDLDGTLTDPFEGITKSIQYAIQKMGRIAPAADALRWCIGPPLQVSFRSLQLKTRSALRTPWRSIVSVTVTSANSRTF